MLCSLKRVTGCTVLLYHTFQDGVVLRCSIGCWSLSSMETDPNCNTMSNYAELPNIAISLVIHNLDVPTAFRLVRTLKHINPR